MQEWPAFLEEVQIQPGAGATGFPQRLRKREIQVQ